MTAAWQRGVRKVRGCARCLQAGCGPPSFGLLPDFGGRRAVSVAAGHISSLAVLDDGSVALWGREASVPQPLLDKKAALASLHAGSQIPTCNAAVFDDGTVAAWGRGWLQERSAHASMLACGVSYAAFADGSTVGTVGKTDSEEVEAAEICSLGAVSDRVVAGLQDGRVHVWAVRNGKLEGPPEVVREGGEAAVCVSLGLDFGLFLLDGGGVAGWGSHRRSKVPKELGGRATAVSAGPNFACVALESGKVVAWGSCMKGQTIVPDFGGRRVAQPLL
eukprot:TRINITY_DN5424_c0_g1_i1.p1 TRINITY_DN5424_c0_g1~~TRINITY_DN5424_c0_g1_i1.p1  ORF type:complete len:276 (+),score=68.90 TRINITY_DN5424_c0_g1_i1:48-875(+)